MTLGLLDTIFNFCKCLVLWLVDLLLAGLIELLNLLIALVMGFVGVLLSLLPAYSPGEADPPPFLAWVAYFFPLSEFITIVIATLTFLIAWTPISMGLRRLGVL